MKQELLNTLGMIFLGVVLFVGGFYFGYKYHKGETDNGMVAGVSDIRETANGIVNIETEIITKELDGVHWIKVNEEPICPVDYPIKGKFDGTVGFYYTKSNNSYGRVKPSLCFATEDFAKNSAGFVRKY